MSLARFFKPSTIKKALKIFREKGPKGVADKLRAIYAYKASFRSRTYDHFRRHTALSEEQLEQQQATKFKTEPVFAIVTPLYKTKKFYLDRLVESFQSQTYPNFKVFFVDASPHNQAGETEVTPLVESYHDERIHYEILKDNKTISENTNVAIDLALKDKEVTHVCLCDHDDELAPSALFEYAKALNGNPHIKIIYCDEDKTDEHSTKFYDPAFKPDFNEFFLESCNYINHFFSVEKSLLKELKEEDGVVERKEYNGAQDYDLYLRLVIKALKLDAKLIKSNDKKINREIKTALYTSSTIHHIPKILYHWRAGDGSTATNSANKLYAFESGKNALEDYYHRRKIDIKKVEISPILGYYRTCYKRKKSPLVSIIIPNKDHIEDLDLAISSVMSGQYDNLEFIVVENNSEEEKTFGYYKQLEKNHKNAQVVYYKGDFNFSKICNFGVKAAKGEYLLLLNNDVEMINPDSLGEMVDLLNRKNVGAVGAKLLFSDNTIQHAGVLVGMGGIAGHLFHAMKDIETEYCCYHNKNNAVQSYSAVTAACLMTTRKIYDEVGGLDESLKVAFNDIDFCLKIRSHNHQVVFTPYSKFFHYESKSRGPEDSPEKIKRFHGEMRNFAKKWKTILEKGDPYYNPNLTLSAKGDCSIRSIREIGQPFYSEVLAEIIDYDRQ
jgi:GT2 family glycosyltransferase